jgi:hypothetical protein
MGPFRDYRRVIQTAPRCCDTKVCAATIADGRAVVDPGPLLPGTPSTA